MSAFTIHDVETAPTGSRATLEAVARSFGRAPNLFGVFAESPAVLKGYTTLAGLLEKDSAFDATELQVVLLTVSFENDCEYCVAAHTTISKMQSLPGDVVEALRDGGPLPDARLEALRTYTRHVLETRGWVSDEAVQAFLDAGYTRRHQLEVVLGLAFKTLSNYVNHAAGTPLDTAFAPAAWKKPESVA